MAIVRPVNRVVVDKKLTLRLDQMPPATTPAWRRRSPMLSGPIRQRAITRSNETTRPLRPRSVVQVTSRCRAMRTSAAFAAGPAARWRSGASKSARRTSIHSLGSAVLPAAELIDSIKPNEFGWYFPSAKDPSKPVSHGTLYSFVWRQRDRGVIPYVTNRDLRRTFKTLAGKAGVSKEIRDRLQNHALQDVSSKNYDRWNYMPEKRAGMARWDKFARALLKKKNGNSMLKAAA